MEKTALKKLISERRQNRVFRENQQRKLLPDEEIFADQIAAKLAGLCETRQFSNFCRCGKEEIYRTCRACGQLEKFAYRCNIKWCPRCQWRISERRRNLILTWAKRVTQPKHMILTQKNFPILTARELKKFTRDMARLRRSLVFKEVHGGCVSIEITNEGKGWHLHSHWLCDARWIDVKALAVTWGNLVGQEFAIVQVLDVRNKSYAHEVCKYLAKGSEIAAWPAEQILEFVLAIRGRRFFFSFGSLFREGAAVRAEIAAAKPPTPACDCGADDFIYETEVSAVLREIRSQK